MQFLVDQWLPIVASAAIVFVVSFITHMVLPHHKSEFGKLPDEEEKMAGLGPVPPGLYMFPCPSSPQEMNSPEFMEKCKRGPNGLLAVWDGPVNMGKNLLLTFGFYLVVGVFVAYVGTHSIAADSTYLERFRICGTVAFCSHGLGWISFFIWFRYGRFWPNMLDSIAFALATAGAFAWLWRA
ncbi:MAG: hypothetical protein AB7F50_00960 [Fimbriimonadaceae bacterium]